MREKIATYLIILFLLTMAFSSIIITSDEVIGEEGDTEGWNVFKGNKKHTGCRASIDGNPKSELAWSFSTNGKVSSSPVVSENGIIYIGSEDRIASICETFGDEVRRLQANDGQVIVPSVTVQDSTNGTRTYEDVVVTPHNVRSDVLQDGVVTALDIILSLGEQGEFSEVGLAWYPTIARADPVDHYFIERIDEAQAYARCGYVYEVGSRQFAGFSGSHIHIPTDTRVLVSPEYGMWFWLCL